MSDADCFDLSRFVEAQEPIFDAVLSELRRGKKESHWMWFIFPQVAGLGTSSMAKRYAISSVDEARAYLSHPVVGPRLLECCKALLAVHGRSALEIMGYPDDLKLRSSMTLFAQVEGAPREFEQVIFKYFAGTMDERTMKPLKDHRSRSPSRLTAPKRYQWHS